MNKITTEKWIIFQKKNKTSMIITREKSIHLNILQSSLSADFTCFCSTTTSVFKKRRVESKC